MNNFHFNSDGHVVADAYTLRGTGVEDVDVVLDTNRIIAEAILLSPEARLVALKALGAQAEMQLTLNAAAAEMAVTS